MSLFHEGLLITPRFVVLKTQTINNHFQHPQKVYNLNNN